jgi:hypothetical protein
LGQSDADSVIDPAHLLSRNTRGYDVIDFGIYRPEEFNLEAAPGLPGIAIQPS